MKLKEITVLGFRGFNVRQSIAVHPRLTLISAPNSHGKTSISEACEWLLYGTTSKLEAAPSKDEYKGSYRNCHLPETTNPFVELVIDGGGTEHKLRAELKDDGIARFFDGKPVARWPFEDELKLAAKPFILQHALKHLLLATPIDRFSGFAALLGFDELSNLRRDLVAFCTRPPIPPRVAAAQEEVALVEARVAAAPTLTTIAKAFTKLKKSGPSETEKLLAAVRLAAKKHVPKGTADTELLAELKNTRDAATAKVLSKPVALTPYSAAQAQEFQREEATLAVALGTDFIEEYAALAALKSVQAVLDRAQFLGIGLKLAESDAVTCPFCTQPITSSVLAHVQQSHAEALAEQREYGELEALRTKLQETLAALRDQLKDYYKRQIQPITSFIEAEAVLPQVEQILLPKHADHWQRLAAAHAAVKLAHADFVAADSALKPAFERVTQSLTDSTEQAADAEALATGIVEFVGKAVRLREVIAQHSENIAAATQVLQAEVETVAGTQVLAILIEILEKQSLIEKVAKVNNVLDSLTKTLCPSVDAYVTGTMLKVISGELAADVTEWYGRIRTTGDPDVHFSGFDMKRTAQGGRVQINAESYGKQLVSAVSSLSESKLNALGLCISIATNLKGKPLFDFLIIDDPIQSWDKDHEIQFGTVIQELVSRGKQVVLLSHNDQWIKSVRQRCEHLGGIYYEISGFVSDGPVIKEIAWAEPKHRLDIVLAIANDKTADQTRLQQAEQELRHAVHQLTSKLYWLVTGTDKSPHTLNAKSVRTILLTCGVESKLVANIHSMFITVDDAHHAGQHYAPNRERLRQYHSWSMELFKLVEARTKSVQVVSVNNQP